MSPRASHDDLHDEGRAIAVILLVLSRKFPTLTTHDWCRILHLDHKIVAIMLGRWRHGSLVLPGVNPKAGLECPICGKWCRDRRGLAAHSRIHEQVICPFCGQTVIRQGLGPHKVNCSSRPKGNP